MTLKPIFVATHPRACSTAFERVFMTYTNTLSCVHEPFGEAWYYGPERLSDRFDTEDARKKSGYSETTYRDIFDGIDENAKGKRLFIKDMAQYWIPLPSNAGSTAIAPSLINYRRGVGTGAASDSDSASTSSNEETNSTEPGNPTVVPDSLLHQFHFTFLIRHPRSSVPSYYRCTIPPLNEMTGFDYFDPGEMGYRELRLLFEYLVSAGHIGPKIAGSGTRTHESAGSASASANSKVDICVVDADDMLDNPSDVIEAYCKSVGIEYDPASLKWDDPQCQENAKEIFEKWKGFHEDALGSNELRARTHKKAVPTDDELLNSWAEKYGEKAAQSMLKTVKENEADYEYLKQFALKA